MRRMRWWMIGMVWFVSTAPSGAAPAAAARDWKAALKPLASTVWELSVTFPDSSGEEGRDGTLLDRAVLAIARRGDGEQALALARLSSEGYDADIREMSLAYDRAQVAGALAEGGFVEAALRMAKEVSQPGHREDAWIAVATGFALAGRRTEAESVIDEELTLEESVRAWLRIADGLEERGVRDAAWHYVELVRDAVSHLDEWQRADRLGEVAALCARMERADVFDGLAAGLKSPVHRDRFYRKAASACSSAKLFRDAARLAEQIRDPAERDSSLASVLGWSARSGHPEVAVAFEGRIWRPWLRVDVLQEAVEGFARAGKRAEAEQCVERLLRLREAPLDTQGRRMPDSVMAHALLAVGRIEEAKPFLNPIGLFPDGIADRGLLFEALLAAGRVNEAEAVLREVRDAHPARFDSGDGIFDDVEWLAEWLAWKGHKREAVAFANGFGNASEKSRARLGITIGMIGTGDVKAALAMARSVPELPFRDMALLAVADSQAEHREFEGALVTCRAIGARALRGEAAFRLGAYLLHIKLAAAAEKRWAARLREAAGIQK